ncbi:DsbA family protein [Propionibacterium sp.]|uniref:DsbA family protein n=1 Tax=Propionibacterium sp. TaxID=1977903 RepID=UPI0039EA5BB4
MASKKAPRNKSANSTPQGAKAANRREALRQQQLQAAAHQRRLRTIVIIVAAIVAVAIIVVVALGTTGVIGGKKSSPASNVTGAQIVPPNATADNTGIMSTLGTNKQAPILVSIEDFQCPACKSYETVYHPVFESLAKEGKIQLEYRMRYFLDNNFHNDSSVRAARAAGCADVVGHFQQYHDTVYANQPSTEGTGYTTDQLRNTFAQQAGITGSDLTTFQTCFDENQTANFSTDVENAASKAGYNSTPTFVVNGKTIQFTQQNPTEDYVMSVINSAS